MNYRIVFQLLGRLALALSIAMLVPTVTALALDRSVLWAFVGPASLTAGIGALIVGRSRTDRQAFGRREAFLLVTATWIFASIVGALPYLWLHGPSFVVDALFESASGFTTTGASILDDIEAESAPLLLWRSMTQWIGGMGMIVLGIAVLPRLAIGGMELLAAEAPGPTTEKLTPRIAQTAKALWVIYAGLTLIEGVTLWLLGMSPFDAANHAFTTMSTGGFSTRNAGIAAFESPTIEVVINLFMVLAGINFALHFKLLRGRFRRVFTDAELLFFLSVLSIATLLVTTDLVRSGRDLLEALRLGAFQVVAICTGTGYATAAFDGWPRASVLILFFLMFVGGCAGSTSGSIKVVRILIALKKLVVDVRRVVQPHAILPVRVGPRAIPEDIVVSVTTFIGLFLTIFVFGALILAFTGLDLESALSVSVAALGNVGPALGDYGPMESYAPLHPVGKLTMVAMMIVGRLELYTVLVILVAGGRLFRRRAASRRVDAAERRMRRIGVALRDEDS